MGFLSFGKKPKNKPLEQKIVDSISENVSVENAIITYILLQSKDNKISLARKDDVTYISFRNPKISDFLKDWYTLLQLNKHKKLGDKVYKVFIQNQLEEYKIKEDTDKDENETEDYL
jgi:hypothetical protein